MKLYLGIVVCLLAWMPACKQQTRSFDGLDTDLGNLYRLSDAKTRSISAENFTGEKGKGGMAELADSVHRNKANTAPSAKELGRGWKVNPFVKVAPGETITLAEIEGPGAIQHIWMTPGGNWRTSILRIYWDDEEEPSVECPVGDFFGMGWGKYAHLNSIPVAVNPGSAFNCYWVMPFRKKCKITIENIQEEGLDVVVFYQVDYTLTEVPDDAAYFHAQFRRCNPTKGSVYTIVDGIQGKGQYVGTYMAWRVHNKGWWGEGEIKFYMDGDGEFPTICGTGTEDYFCGSYAFWLGGNEYATYSTAYTGFHQALPADSVFQPGQRFGLYRWHIKDPVRFEKDLRITIQDLGLSDDLRYLPQESDIASVAYWYQTEPHQPFPELPSRQDLEKNLKK